MKHIYKQGMVTALMLLCMAIGAIAQSISVNVAYKDSYNQYNYKGYVVDNNVIHAIGSGEATVSFSGMSLPTGATLDSIKVHVPGFADKKVTSETGTASYTFNSPAVDATYTFSATVYYTANRESNNFDVNAVRSVHLYAEPSMPAVAEAGVADQKLEANDDVKLQRSVTIPFGGNASGWNYNWNIRISDNPGASNTTTSTGRELNIDAPTTFTAETKAIRSVSFSCEVSNTAPNGTADWVKTTIEGFNGCTIYNTPKHQPQQLGHFVDKGSNQDYYIAMNLGLDDATAQSYGYKYMFTGLINNTDNYFLTTTIRHTDELPSGTYSLDNVVCGWEYDDGFRTPSDAKIAQMGKIETVELGFDYILALDVQPGIYANDSRYRQEAVPNGDGYMYLEGCDMAISYQIQPRNMTVSNSNVAISFGEFSSNKTSLSGSVVFNNMRQDNYRGEINVTGRMVVDTNQTLDVESRFESDKQYWFDKAPIFETTDHVTLTILDTEPANLNIFITKTEGLNLWNFSMGRLNITDDEYVDFGSSTWVNDDWLDDPSETKSIKEYSYLMHVTYYTPNPDYYWFDTTVEMARVTVYNTPTQPGALLYLNDDGKDVIATVNLGLSDEQVRDREYVFEYEMGDGTTERVNKTRYYTGTKSPTRVRTLWAYDDANITSDWATRVDAAPNETLDYSNDPSTLAFYLGGCYVDDKYYMISSTDLTLSVNVEDNYVVDAASISIDGDDGSELTILDGNHAVRTFTPDVTDITTYKATATLQVTPIYDWYYVDGERQYIKANTSVTFPGLQYPCDIVVYPVPVYPEVGTIVEDFDNYSDLANYTKEISMVGCTGANADGWVYNWCLNDATLTSDAAEISPYTVTGLPSFAGKNREYNDYVYKMRVRNMVPGTNQAWIAGYIDALDVRVYNNPATPTRLTKVVNEDHNLYVACETGVYTSTREDNSYKYEFEGIEGLQDQSWIESNDVEPAYARAAYVYEASGRHGEYTAYSLQSTETQTFTPTFRTDLYFDRVRYDYEPYGYENRQGETGVYTIEDQSRAQYTIHAPEYPNEIFNGEIKIGTLTASQSSDYRTTAFSFDNILLTEVGDFTPVVTGEMHFLDDESTYSSIRLPYQYTVPEDQTVHVYPKPVFMSEVPQLLTQFRDIDTVVPFEETTEYDYSGANPEGWNFEWLVDNNSLGVGNACVVEPQEIASGGMETRTHEITLHWFNRSPMPGDDTEWLSGDASYIVHVYNTPEQPARLTRKGNGTSGIFIVTGMSLSDSQLQGLNYQFQFGQNDPVEDNALSIEEVGRRWYAYNSYGTPWVRSVWRYNDFDCFSDYTTSDNSRGDLGIEDLYDYEGDDMRVYSTTGRYMGNVPLKQLGGGVYIVEIGPDDSRTVHKVIVK